MMPELFLADALGAAGKPLLRVHTAGSVGGSTGDRRAPASSGGRAQAGAGGGVREAVGVQRDVGAVGPAAVQHAGARRRGRLLRAARPLLHPALRRARRTSARSSRPRTGRTRSRTRTPTCSSADITLESVLASQMLWDPIRYDETCPSSDGACAVVIADEDAAAAPPADPAWIHGTVMRSEPTTFAERDQVNPQAGPRRARPRSGSRPASPTRSSEIDVAEIYVPFSWFEPMWLENLGFAEAGRGLEAHRGRRDRASAAGCRSTRPAACSRSNPIGASGHAPLRRGGAAGHGQGRRAPGRRRPRALGTPTAAARSSSRCGWWRVTRADPGGCRAGTTRPYLCGRPGSTYVELARVASTFRVLRADPIRAAPRCAMSRRSGRHGLRAGQADRPEVGHAVPDPDPAMADRGAASSACCAGRAGAGQAAAASVTG